MKPILTFFFLLLILTGYSQDYINKIANECCSCAQKIPDTLVIDDRNMQLGLCMINAAMPYKKQLKKDFNINMDNVDTEGEAIGKFLGIKMAAICPDVLIKMYKQNETGAQEEVVIKSIKGIVTGVESDFFVVFSIKDNTGKTTKYYWLTFIESGIELTDSYKTLIGRSVEITFETNDLYDPKIQEYRSFNVIRSLNLF